YLNPPLSVYSPSSFLCYGDHPALHSFPTRRSSDLPVAEDVQHQRLALACSVFQACTHALASTEVSYLAGCTLARVVVEAAHADRTCARIALNDELHHGRRFLEFAVSAEVRPEDRGDVRILGRIERTRIAERIDRIGCLHVAAQESLTNLDILFVVERSRHRARFQQLDRSLVQADFRLAEERH